MIKHFYQEIKEILKLPSAISGEISVIKDDIKQELSHVANTALAVAVTMQNVENVKPDVLELKQSVMLVKEKLAELQNSLTKEVDLLRLQIKQQQYSNELNRVFPIGSIWYCATDSTYVVVSDYTQSGEVIVCNYGTDYEYLANIDNLFPLKSKDVLAIISCQFSK